MTAYDIQSDRYIHYSNSDESVQINSFKKDVIDLFNGKLYAGGHGGFVSMASSKFPSKKINSNPVIITDIKVSNNSFFFNPQRQSNDLSTRSIWLEPEDNNLEIFFSALQFTATSRIRYAYKMDGVDKEWVYTETGNRSAFYNKIPKDIILSRYALQMNTATGKTTSQNYVSIKSRLGTKHGGHTVPI